MFTAWVMFLFTMLHVQFSIDRVSLGVHSMGDVIVHITSCSVQY